MNITVEYKHNRSAGFFSFLKSKHRKKKSLSTKMRMKDTKRNKLHSKRQAQLTSHLFFLQAILMLD